MEVMGVEMLNDLTPETAKNRHNFHTFLIYLGEEDYETLKKELVNPCESINQLVQTST